MAYTLQNFKNDFDTEEDCLAAIFHTRFGNTDICPACSKRTKFYRVAYRRAYVTNCGHHIYPTAGTVFEKTTQPLTNWFFVIYLFGTSKNGVSAKEIQRHLDCTYKTAHRMARLIRSTMVTIVSDKEEGVTNDLLKKNFLASVEGTYHWISSKYFNYYLAEFMFRHENRKETVTPLLLERVMSYDC